jgi:hypothetical protein
MTQKVADKWFNDVDFTSIVSTIKGIMTSDGSISILLDFERVLDESDLYAFKNWIYGELVQGPDVGRYSVTCTFMWPYKLMPDPRGAKRLLSMGCDVDFDESKIRVPVEIKNYDDFIQGTNYPKSTERKVWFVKITVPLELMDDIKEGSIDLADQTIDLNELDEAYDEDLDKQNTDDTESNNEADNALAQDSNLGPPLAPTGI